MAMYKTAPDGGPLSNAHLYLTTVRNKLMRVRNKKTGKIVLINAKRFKKEYYEEVNGEVEITQKTQESPTPPKIEPFGTQPQEELLTYTRDELRNMPEYTFIEKKPIDKNGIVDEILKVREKRKSGEL